MPTKRRNAAAEDAQAAAERRRDARLVDVVDAAAKVLGLPRGELVKAAVRAALVALVDSVRAEANEIREARKQGWGSLSTGLDAVAARLAIYEGIMANLAVDDVDPAVAARHAGTEPGTAPVNPDVTLFNGQLTGIATPEGMAEHVDELARARAAKAAALAGPNIPGSYGPGDPVPAWANSTEATPAALGAALEEAATMLAGDPFSEPMRPAATFTGTVDPDPFISPEVAAMHPLDPFSDPANFAPAGTELVQPSHVPGIEGAPIKALNIGEAVTPPVASVTVVEVEADPFSEPGGRAAIKRLTWDEFEALAEQLKAEPAKAISLSKVEAIGSCGVKHALGRLSRRGLVRAERPDWSTIGGNAFHHAIGTVETMIDARGLPEVTAMPAHVWETFLHAERDRVLTETRGQFTAADIRASAQGLENYDWWRVNGLAMVDRYLTYHNAEWRARHRIMHLSTPAGGPPPAAVEAEFYLDTSRDPWASNAERVMVHGFIDIMWEMNVGNPAVPQWVPTIRDWKTGKTPGSVFQRATYSHAAMRAFGVEGPILSANWDARQGGYTDLTDATLAHPWSEVTGRYATADRIDKLGLFVANPSTFCGGCAHEAICPVRAGV